MLPFMMPFLFPDLTGAGTMAIEQVRDEWARASISVEAPRTEPARTNGFVVAVPTPATQATKAPVGDPAPPTGAAAPAPRGFVLIGPPATAAGNEIHRAADGLFYVTAIVNGAAVRFVIDTGASVVVLNAEDARRAGLAVDASDYSSRAQTANGPASMARVTLTRVEVGSVRAEAIDAAVVGQGLPVSLLGQSWLSRLQSVTITRDRMVLN